MLLTTLPITLVLILLGTIAVEIHLLLEIRKLRKDIEYLYSNQAHLSATVHRAVYDVTQLKKEQLK